jgi:hypothetical protein
MSTKEKVFLNENKNDFVILEFRYTKEVVTNIEFYRSGQFWDKDRHLSTYALSREEAIKKANEIYNSPWW